MLHLIAHPSGVRWNGDRHPKGVASPHSYLCPGIFVGRKPGRSLKIEYVGSVISDAKRLIMKTPKWVMRRWRYTCAREGIM